MKNIFISRISKNCLFFCKKLLRLYESKLFKQILAFSLVELMISLITVCCIAAAFTPIVTKKLASQKVAVSGGAQGDSDLSDCATKSFKYPSGDPCPEMQGTCLLCTEEACATCEIECEANQYRNDSCCICEDCSSRGNGHCIRCNSDECERCEAGYYLTDEGNCEICPEGAYCPEGSKCPTPCTGNLWTGTIDDIGTDAAKGKIQCDFGCPAGKYCHSEKEGNNCPVPIIEDCLKGHACYLGKEMEECRPGTYQDEKGKTSCKNCPAGTTGLEGRESVCED